jgi:hypothetical protein
MVWVKNNPDYPHSTRHNVSYVSFTQCFAPFAPKPSPQVLCFPLRKVSVLRLQPGKKTAGLPLFRSEPTNFIYPGFVVCSCYSLVYRLMQLKKQQLKEKPPAIFSFNCFLCLNFKDNCHNLLPVLLHY